jgi:hypothetical protein
MRDEKPMEYDHGSSLSFVNSLQSICALMAGFVFTGITVVLATLAEPVPLLTQAILFTLLVAMHMFSFAMWELHLVNVLTCLHSPKPIIPNYPARWRVINTLIIVGSLLELFSVNLLFLLRDLRELFALSMGVSVPLFALLCYRWKPIKEKLDERWSACG